MTFTRGALRSLAVIAAFVAGGLTYYYIPDEPLHEPTRVLEVLTVAAAVFLAVEWRRARRVERESLAEQAGRLARKKGAA